jgi:hypothetical protein
LLTVGHFLISRVFLPNQWDVHVIFSSQAEVGEETRPRTRLIIIEVDGTKTVARLILERASSSQICRFRKSWEYLSPGNAIGKLISKLEN